MEPFNLWGEAFVFIGVFSILMSIPCIFVVFLGRNMMDQIGYFPTKTPAIQMKIVMKLVAVEVMAFLLFVGFYLVFT